MFNFASVVLPGVMKAPLASSLPGPPLDPEAGEGSREASPKVGLRTRLSAVSPQRLSARPPPLAHLAFQDLRRASEIKSALELDGAAVSISTALNPKEVLPRRKSKQAVNPEDDMAAGQAQGNLATLAADVSAEVDSASRPATAASGQLPPIDSTGSRSESATAASSRAVSPSKGALAASPSPPPSGKRPESRSKSPGAGKEKDKPEGGGKKKGKKGKKGGKKGKKATVEGPEPNLSLLRVGGPLAPFLPGLVRRNHPEEWARSSRQTADALIRLNPAGE